MPPASSSAGDAATTTGSAAAPVDPKATPPTAPTVAGQVIAGGPQPSCEPESSRAVVLKPTAATRKVTRAEHYRLRYLGKISDPVPASASESAPAGTLDLTPGTTQRRLGSVAKDINDFATGVLAKVLATEYSTVVSSSADCMQLPQIFFCTSF